MTNQSPFATLSENRIPAHTYPEATTTVEVIDQDLSAITLTIPAEATSKRANAETQKTE